MFGGVSLFCVWDSFVWVWGSECVLCVGEIRADFGGVRLCCVWESLGRVWGSEFVLCVGQFVVGLWDSVFAVCGTVCSVSGVSESVLCVG